MATNPVSPTPELAFDVEKSPEEIIVHCTGRITSSTTALLQNTVKPLIKETQRATLDLTHVTYMDSSGLGAMVGLYVSARAAKCQLRVINLNQRLKELFSMTRVGEFLTEGHDPNYLGMP